MAARRRKVHSTPFPPGGENCVRSLAPPLPGEPASLGFAGSNEGLGKAPPGTAPDERFVLIVAYPIPSVATRHLPLTGGVGPGPHYGGYPLGQAESFRRAKSECLFAIQSGPPGPGCAKIAADAVPHLRLAFLSQRSRCESWRAGLGPAPTRETGPSLGAGVLSVSVSVLFFPEQQVYHPLRGL